MTPLTEVAILFLPDRENNWLRFGVPVWDCFLDRRRAAAWFAPGAVFAYIRWQNGDFGTVLWRLYVLRAGRPADPLNRVPGVTPGAEILLRVDGTPKVKQVLDQVDALEAAGFDPTDVSPDWWRQVHHRLAVNAAVRAYAPEQHAAWLRRRDLAS